MRIQLFEKWMELNYIFRVIPIKVTTNIMRRRLPYLTSQTRKIPIWLHSQFPGLSRETNYLKNKRSIETNNLHDIFILRDCMNKYCV